MNRNYNWRHPSLSESTPMISYMELTHLSSEVSNYYYIFYLKSVDFVNYIWMLFDTLHCKKILWIYQKMYLDFSMNYIVWMIPCVAKIFLFVSLFSCTVQRNQLTIQITMNFITILEPKINCIFVWQCFTYNKS